MRIDQYFDSIKVINSKNRIDRYKNMIDRFIQQGLIKSTDMAVARREFMEKFRFEAVMGGSVDHRQLNFGERKKPLNNGEIGCFLSHTTLFEMAKENNWDKLLILEDDARFEIDFERKFSEAIKEVPDDWDMLYLGQWNYDHQVNGGNAVGGKTYALKEQIGKYVWKANGCWLTHAYAVRQKALDYLIDNTKILYSSVDNVLSDIQHELNVYAIHPNIINQDGTRSSLR